MGFPWLSQGMKIRLRHSNQMALKSLKRCEEAPRKDLYESVEQEERHEMPYPALRWEWKTIMSWPWRQEAHINELELCSVVATIKHRGRSASKRGKRCFLVVDSMVSRGALAKGRSSSKRLNRVLRRGAASLLAQNSYMVPIWTISRWNFSDHASRRFED